MSKNPNFFSRFEPPSMTPPLNVYWKKAIGSTLWDANKKYIDFTSTIFVTNIGHGNLNMKKKLEKFLILQLVILILITISSEKNI